MPNWAGRRVLESPYLHSSAFVTGWTGGMTANGPGRQRTAGSLPAWRLLRADAEDRAGPEGTLQPDRSRVGSGDASVVRGAEKWTIADWVEAD